jgi:2-hydroxy-3-keto-5-methylthiopentenyl-1-phosphate phosphatase
MQLLAVPLLLVLLLVPLSTASTPPKKPIIFLDFDGTLATSDAFNTLALTAYKSLPPTSQVPSWSHFTDLYNSDYTQLTTTFGLRPNLTSELHFQSLSALSRLEHASYTRVKRSGLFHTASAALLREAAGTISVRPGFHGFLRAARSNSADVSVLSRNWSPSWIRAVLSASAANARERTLLADVRIFSPEILSPYLLLRARRGADKNIDVPVFSGEDKRRVMRAWAKGRDVVFVGDGNSDLAPLLGAPTVVGVIAGLNAEAAGTVGKEEGWEVWNATAGWRGVTGLRRKAVYVLEKYDELPALLGWE